MAGKRIDRQLGSCPGHDARRTAGFGQCRNRAQVFNARSRLDCRLRNHGIDTLGTGLADLTTLGGAEILLRANDHFRHGLHRRHRKVPGRRFRRQHHGIGAIEDRIGHIHDFGTGWGWARDHRLHHLGRSDHSAIQGIGAVNKFLLHADQRGITNFHTQVTAGHHDHVGRKDDLVHLLIVTHRFRTLHFCDDGGIAARFPHRLARDFEILAAAGKTNGKKIDIELSREFDVLIIFFG